MNHIQIVVAALVLSSMHFASPAAVTGRKDVGLDRDSGEARKMGDEMALPQFGSDLILQPDLTSSPISLIPLRPLLAAKRDGSLCKESRSYREPVVANPSTEEMERKLENFLLTKNTGRGNKLIQCLLKCNEQGLLHPRMCQSLCSY